MGRGIDVARHEVWRRRLERFSGWSGTVAEFCRREGVTQGTFYLWRKRLPRESAVSHAVRSALAPEAVRATDDAQRAASFVELSLTGRTVLVEIELPLRGTFQTRRVADFHSVFRSGTERRAHGGGWKLVREERRCQPTDRRGRQPHHVQQLLGESVPAPDP